MSRSYPLPRGPRARLRLASARDQRSIRALLEGAGAGVEDAALEAARLVRADPRRLLVICATGLIGTTETLLGVGELSRDDVPAVPVTVVDTRLSDGLDELLSSALLARAGAAGRARAA
jgi:hypothetical protein